MFEIVEERLDPNGLKREREIVLEAFHGEEVFCIAVS